MISKHAVSDAFNEAAIPALTFVQPKEFSDLVGSLLMPGKHVTLCGPSGCGKTTLARKALDKAKFDSSKHYWMSGRSHPERPGWMEVFAAEFGCAPVEAEVIEYLLQCGLLVIDDFHHLEKRVRD